MKPNDLLVQHAELWRRATRHPFLVAISQGTLDSDIFATWLVQDYLFVASEFACQSRLLACVPRNAQRLLISSLQALEAELSWFELHAKTRNLALNVTPYATTAAYSDFLNGLEHKPHAVAMTAIWAVERAYLESWQSTLPGHPNYREYSEHWTSVEFESFVTELENAAADALEASHVDEEAESVFLQVAHLEHAFWEMAWSGGAR